jgi:hypothetical protein
VGLDVLTRGFPKYYSVVSNTEAIVRPVPDRPYTGTLYYFALPAVLTGALIPSFPDDQILIDFLEIRYKEWLQMVPKGSALAYMRQQSSELQKAGYGSEIEPDQIELDKNYFGDGAQQDRDDWMGKTSV